MGIKIPVQSLSIKDLVLMTHSQVTTNDQRAPVEFDARDPNTRANSDRLTYAIQVDNGVEYIVTKSFDDLARDYCEFQRQNSQSELTPQQLNARFKSEVLQSEIDAAKVLMGKLLEYQNQNRSPEVQKESHYFPGVEGLNQELAYERLMTFLSTDFFKSLDSQSASLLMSVEYLYRKNQFGNTASRYQGNYLLQFVENEAGPQLKIVSLAENENTPEDWESIQAYLNTPIQGAATSHLKNIFTSPLDKAASTKFVANKIGFRTQGSLVALYGLYRDLGSRIIFNGNVYATDFDYPEFHQSLLPHHESMTVCLNPKFPLKFFKTLVPFTMQLVEGAGAQRGSLEKECIMTGSELAILLKATFSLTPRFVRELYEFREQNGRALPISSYANQVFDNYEPKDEIEVDLEYVTDAEISEDQLTRSISIQPIYSDEFPPLSENSQPIFSHEDSMQALASIEREIFAESSTIERHSHQAKLEMMLLNASQNIAKHAKPVQSELYEVLTNIWVEANSDTSFAIMNKGSTEGILGLFRRLSAKLEEYTSRENRVADVYNPITILKEELEEYIELNTFILQRDSLQERLNPLLAKRYQLQNTRERILEDGNASEVQVQISRIDETLIELNKNIDEITQQLSKLPKVVRSATVSVGINPDFSLRAPYAWEYLNSLTKDIQARGGSVNLAEVFRNKNYGKEGLSVVNFPTLRFDTIGRSKVNHIHFYDKRSDGSMHQLTEGSCYILVKAKRPMDVKTLFFQGNGLTHSPLYNGEHYHSIIANEFDACYLSYMNLAEGEKASYFATEPNTLEQNVDTLNMITRSFAKEYEHFVSNAFCLSTYTQTVTSMLPSAGLPITADMLRSALVKDPNDELFQAILNTHGRVIFDVHMTFGSDLYQRYVHEKGAQMVFMQKMAIARTRTFLSDKGGLADGYVKQYFKLLNSGVVEPNIIAKFSGEVEKAKVGSAGYQHTLYRAGEGERSPEFLYKFHGSYVTSHAMVNRTLEMSAVGENRSIMQNLIQHLMIQHLLAAQGRIERVTYYDLFSGTRDVTSRDNGLLEAYLLGNIPENVKTSDIYSLFKQQVEEYLSDGEYYKVTDLPSGHDYSIVHLLLQLGRRDEAEALVAKLERPFTLIAPQPTRLSCISSEGHQRRVEWSSNVGRDQGDYTSLLWQSLKKARQRKDEIQREALEQTSQSKQFQMLGSASPRIALEGNESADQRRPFLISGYGHPQSVEAQTSL